TALSYGADYYRNPHGVDKELLSMLGLEAVRTMRLDYVASQALRKYSRDGNLDGFSVSMGGARCELKESSALTLEPAIRMRCPSIVQTTPVVRRGVDRNGVPDGNRYVQVGDKLMYADCRSEVNGQQVQFFPGDPVSSNPSERSGMGSIQS